MTSQADKFTIDDCLPADLGRALLVGRVWRKDRKSVV